MHTFTVATANTLLGQASRDSGGLGKAVEADILLLQEVISPAQDNFRELLEQSGFTVPVIIGRSGLAIAVRTESSFTPVAGSLRTQTFEKLSGFERLLVKILAKQENEFAERGMVAVKLASKDGSQLTVVNVHPGISFASKRIRNRQITAFSNELNNPYYDGTLVITGDMNHYPGPQAIDLEVRKKHGLTAVDLAGQPTWVAKGSHYEKFARIAAFFTRRSLTSYDGELDAILYRKPFLAAVGSEVVEIQSDHRAILSTFEFASTQS